MHYSLLVVAPCSFSLSGVDYTHRAGDVIKVSPAVGRKLTDTKFAYSNHFRVIEVVDPKPAPTKLQEEAKVAKQIVESLAPKPVVVEEKVEPKVSPEFFPTLETSQPVSEPAPMSEPMATKAEEPVVEEVEEETKPEEEESTVEEVKKPRRKKSKEKSSEEV